MAKTTQNAKATEAALDAAADSAKDAKKLAKTLPKKDAKKLRKLADDAKVASSASKKSIKRNPGKVVGRAIASVASIATAVGRMQKRRDSAGKSTASKAAPSQPAPTKKAAPQKAPTKKATPQKAAANAAPSATPNSSAIDLSSLTVAQLKEHAQKAGHTGYSRFTKTQLIDLLSSRDAV